MGGDETRMILSEFKFKLNDCRICANHELSRLSKNDLLPIDDISTGATYLEKKIHASLRKQESI
jgi:hypothetical protein